MRIAIAGKGGAGKTTVSATLSRLEGRLGHRVVAIDADSNPNLATALGVTPECAALLGPVPVSVVSRRLDGRSALTLPVGDVVNRYGAVAPDGVRLMVLGAPAHAGMCCLCAAHAVVAALLSDLTDYPGL
ncbi:MAG: nucleotide-binding protein, partial [Acidimicrobiales bacterium]